MCGLLGILCATPEQARQLLAPARNALQIQRHRGPDETDIQVFDEAVLGLNRLALVDVDHAHQPLLWGPPEAPRRYALLFNGEIYNHQELRDELTATHGAAFATLGDGEAIVAAYHHHGAESVSRLRGMFAFVIWDTRDKVLFGARDPFGIKPLYWAAGPGGVAFSSEKKSLLALAPALGVGLALDPAALQHYLALQYVPEPETLHAAVRRIESGTWLRVTPGGELHVQRYFLPRFESKATLSAPSADALHRRIADALRDSVRAHMVADPGISVGTFLSGGIDSTAIAVLAKEFKPDLVAFTVGFKTPGYSEIDVASQTAEVLGIEHVVRTVDVSEVMQALPMIIWALDDPLADPSLVPLYFVAREASSRVKAVLSGEGADELFAGYPIYGEGVSLAPFEKVPSVIRTLMGRVSTMLPDGMRGKDLLRRGALRLEQRYYGNARIFLDDPMRGVLRSFREGVSHEDVTAPWYRHSQAWDPISRMQHIDLFTWLRGNILAKADKMTMAHSLELRVPFLDAAVLQAACEVPADQKIAGGTTKFALRRALQGLVPPHVLEREKLGFPVPIRQWLRNEMHDWARGIVAESATDRWLDKGAVLRMLEAHYRGQADHSRRLWALLCFMIWHGIFIEGRIAPDVPCSVPTASRY
jgi:asparagine synthase (glutamine-hydrolysing)